MPMHTIHAGGGQSKSTVTYLVASVDTTDAVKHGADYICDGVNDQTEIQAAINDLPASGGRVELSEGTFHINIGDHTPCGHGEIYYGIGINASHGAITIEGVPGATILLRDDHIANDTYDPIILYIYGVRATRRTSPTYIYGITFNANWTNNPSTVYYTYGAALTGHFSSAGINVTQCRFLDPRYFGIQFCYISEIGNVVKNCYFEGEGGIRSEAYNLIATDNIFNLSVSPHGGESGGVSLAPDSDESYPNPPGGDYLNYGATVSNNIFFGGGNGVSISQSFGNTVTGNVFADNCGAYNYALVIGNLSHYNTVSHNTFYNVKSCGIWVIQQSGYNLIEGNVILAGQDRAIQWGIHEQNNGGMPHNNVYKNNIIKSNSTAIKIDSATAIVRGNYGWTTENSGTATVENGDTTVVVTHGLSVTPTADDIMVTPTNDLGTATKFWVDTLTATQFTINVDGDPGAGTATFAWKAIVL